MKLEIDVIVQYLLDKFKVRLLFKDLKVKSLYNFYFNKGLLLGLIVSLSLELIEVVLVLEVLDYLFYVMKKDGLFGYLFVKMYKEYQ